MTFHFDCQMMRAKYVVAPQLLHFAMKPGMHQHNKALLSGPRISEHCQETRACVNLTVLHKDRRVRGGRTQARLFMTQNCKYTHLHVYLMEAHVNLTPGFVKKKKSDAETYISDMAK